MKGVTPYRSLYRVTGPASEPVTLAEAKVQCRVDADITTEDTYITTLITAAREHIEDLLDIAVISQTWETRYDGFMTPRIARELWEAGIGVFPGREIVLPTPPLTTGTVTVTYRDLAGVDQTLSSANSDFQVDYRTKPGRIYPNYLENWPNCRGDENSVVIRFSCGYANAAAVPASLKHLILFLIVHWYEMRQPVVTGYSQVLPVPKTFDALLAACGWGDYRQW